MKNFIKTAVTAIIGAIVVVSVALGIYHPSSQTVIQTVKGSNAEISSPYTVTNGVTEWFFSEPMRTGTSTLCSFKAPQGTSSLMWASWDVSVGTTTALVIDTGIGSTSPTATTTVLVSTNVASNGTGATKWTPVGGNVQDGVLLGTSSSTAAVNTNWVNMVAGGAAPVLTTGVYSSTTRNSLYAPNGHCEVEFIQQ